MKATWNRAEFSTLISHITERIRELENKRSKALLQLDKDQAEYSKKPWVMRYMFLIEPTVTWGFETSDAGRDAYWLGININQCKSLRTKVLKADATGASSLTLSDDELACVKKP